MSFVRFNEVAKPNSVPLVPKDATTNIFCIFANDNGDWDFSDDAVVTKPVIAAKAEITQEEKDKVADLMARLGL